MPFLGQRSKGFAQHSEIGDIKAGLTCSCSEKLTFRPYDVTNINFLERFVPLLAEIVLAERELYLARAIANIEKGYLAHLASGHNSAGERYRP